MKKGAFRSNKSRKSSRWDNSYWKLLLSVLFWLSWVGGVLFLVQYMVAVVAVLLIGHIENLSPAVGMICNAISDVIAVILVVMTPKWLSKLLNPRAQEIAKHRPLKERLIQIADDVGIKELPSWTDIGLAPASYIIYVLVSGALVSFFSTFPWFNINEAQDLGLDFFMSGPEKLISFFALVVVAPIAEEILFRGVLYGKLREIFLGKMPEYLSMLFSILLVSLLFGFIHMQWNVGVDVFALSLVLCSLREITGTINAGILLHMVKNGIAFYLVYVLGTGLL